MTGTESAVERIVWHLERLVALDGAPGHEHGVARYVRDALSRIAEVREDIHGNLLCQLEGPRTGPTLLIAAHLDEVALVVKSVEPDGFLRVSALGSVIGELTPGRVVSVGGHVGVVGVRAGHFWNPTVSEAPDPLATQGAYVDVGARDAASVRDAGIDVGTPIVFSSPLQRFGLDRDLVVGKAVDDRLGCAMLLTLLERERPPAGTLLVAFTVQEEVGLRGAGALASRVAPDLALALDMIACGDTPDMRYALDVPLRLGAGPALAVASGPRGTGLIVQPPVTAFLRQVAADAGIAVQSVVYTGGDNDATAMAWAGAGHRAASISIPRRYSHSPVEVADLDDVLSTFTWLRALLGTMSAWPDEVRTPATPA